MRKKSGFINGVLSFVLVLVLAFSGALVPGGEHIGIGTVEASAAAAKLSKKKKTLNVGKSFTLKVRNASKKFKFESSDPSVAKVKTKSGKKTKIVAVSAGKAVITATLGKTVLKCTVTVKGKQVKVTATPAPTPEVIPVCTASTDNSSVFDLEVGSRLQLQLAGKEVRRFYVFDSDKQYLDVTEDGFVTALKPAANPVTVQIEDKTYTHYRCKINIIGDGEATTPAPTSAPVTTPVPTSAPAVTATPTPTPAQTPVPTQIPDATPEPTATPVATDEIKELTDDEINELLNKDTYGILNTYSRGSYESDVSYDVTDEKSMIIACHDGLEKGAENIVLNFPSNYNDWVKPLQAALKCRSELSGYFSLYNIMARGNQMTLMPVYKRGWKAVLVLRYYDYPADTEVKKLLRDAYRLADKTVRLYPGDLRGAMLYLNNTFCDMVTYSDPFPPEGDVYQRDATGAFYYGDGICAAYTSAMRLVLHIMGIENGVRDNQRGTHIWNVVKIDGTWYHIDITWNDTKLADGTYQNYWFLVTDSEMRSKNANWSDTGLHLWYEPYVN